MASTVTDTTRAWNGTSFPVPGTWVIDPAHTSVAFAARHLMVAKVRGRLVGVEGELDIADDPTASTTHISIDAASIDTGVQQRDDHLRSADFLDAARYNKLTFTATRFEHIGDDEWKLYGELTLRDVTRPVVFSTEFNGTAVDPWGGHRSFFSARTKIDREDWGLTWNQALESSGWLVGKEITIDIDVEAVLQG